VHLIYEFPITFIVTIDWFIALVHNTISNKRKGGNDMKAWMGQQAAADQNDTEVGQQSHFRQSAQGHVGAQRGGSLRQKGGIGMVLRNAQELGLKPEHEEKLNKMRTDFELEKVDLLAALSKAKIIFRSLARDLDSSEQDVMNAIDELAKREADLRKMRYRHLKQTHSVLDEDVMGKLRTLHKERKLGKIEALRPAKRGPSGMQSGSADSPAG
jgi:hypothetical protein